MNATNQQLTVMKRFMATVRAHGDAVALRQVQPDQSHLELTYREYAELVARCAAGLQRLGFGRGQRLVLMVRNRVSALQCARCS